MEYNRRLFREGKCKLEGISTECKVSVLMIGTSIPFTVLFAFSRVDNGFFYFAEFQDAVNQVPPGPLAQKGKRTLVLRNYISLITFASSPSP